MSCNDIPDARFLLVFTAAVVKGYAVRAYWERGRSLEKLDTTTLSKAYPVATRRFLENRDDNAQ